VSGFLRVKEQYAADSCLTLDALATAGRSEGSYLALGALVIVGRSVADALGHWTTEILMQMDDLETQEESDLSLRDDRTCSLSPPLCTHLSSNPDK
jgi:hypothetical protein